MEGNMEDLEKLLSALEWAVAGYCDVIKEVLK